MKKFLNEPEAFVDEMLEGIYAAHPQQLTYVADDKRCLVSVARQPGKVGLATGGGSGHLPLFLGYVGRGMLDGCAVGGVFQSPSAQQMFEVTKAIDQGAGVLYIYGNYTGDILNFDMATELAEMENIRVLSVVGNDDVASSVQGEEHKRRGVAGIFFVYKAAGAAAEEGMSLDEVTRVADKARLATRTMGVALSSCIVPEVGHATFSIGEREMEIGMGIHGEPGIRRGPLLPADAVVDEMLKPILAELQLGQGSEVAVLVNGLGGTPQEELYVMYRRIHQVLGGQGVQVAQVHVGEFATAMEMAGASISLIKLDDELKRLITAPADTPFFRQHPQAGR
ncbi:dihydroxyacetone kinase subunit DhaK [Aquincola tertiaricarbonis]|uniref:Dihydroxyacetone kinase subunit DhaK n=1 Tax=Aquincola tertiaricarbonis TaxID=391953 RepID=A0ABY4S5S5_AQUTE|nr:dihydroxyacetone kinase subunit DhaK [Aquincola tertiaricarbonis]URI06441.1 dihydroxyacetone kinase subunit DhaK [Aquincola tertiaricarbonis]